MESHKRSCSEPIQVVRNVRGNPIKIRGYGAVFYNAGDSKTEYRMGPGTVERIHAKAFRNIGDWDIRSMVNHKPEYLLGRTSAGTMRVGLDNFGCWYETDLPDTNAGRDIAKTIDRGDIDGSSFWFEVDGDSYEIRYENGVEILNLVSIKNVREMGPVVFPAYSATTAETTKQPTKFQKSRPAKPNRDRDYAAATMALFEFSMR